MDKGRQIFRICAGNLERISGNPRLYLAFAWFAMTIAFYMVQVRRLAYSLGETVSAWVFPLLMAKSGNQMFFILGAVLLFCDAPFLYDNSGWQILRAGRRTWFWGNILYIGVLSLLYTAIVSVLPAVFAVPKLSLANEWGRLIGSLGQTSLASQSGLTSLSYIIMSRYSPLEAMGIAGLAAWLNAVLVGVVSYAANLLLKQGAGAVICMAMGLTPVIISGALPPVSYFAYYLSPPSWINPENYNRKGYGAAPSPLYIYLAFAVLIAGCVLAARVGIVKKDLYTIQDL